MRLTLILLISYIVCGIRAQDLNVKAFVEASQDLTARTTPRQDLNGVECALIKVRIVGKDVRIKLISFASPVSARPDPPTKGGAVKAAPTLAAWQRNLTSPYHILVSPSPHRASSSVRAA